MAEEKKNGNGGIVAVPKAVKKDKVRLLLADDHSLFRAGLKDLLDGTSHFVIIAEASTGPEALDMVEKKKPDIVLMDIRLPGMDGIACTRQIKKMHPDVTVLVLSMYDDESHVSKPSTPAPTGISPSCSRRRTSSARSRRCIRTAIHPGQYHVPAHGRPPQAGPDGDGRFQRRGDEIRTAGALLAGSGTVEQADRRGDLVSEKTVKNHLNHLFKKLGVKNRTEAVVKAIERGLVSMQ